MKISARKALNFLALASVLLGATVAAQSPPSRIPESLPSTANPNGPPQWVSARAISRSDGELRWEFLRPAQRDLFQSQFQSGRAEERGCAVLGGFNVTLPDPQPHSSASDLVGEAQAIYSGTVVAIEPGFLSSLPGLMLEIEVDEVFKENPAFQGDEGLFIFYPRGDFTIGRHRFCVEGTHLPAPPTKGTRLMVFPFSVPTDLNRSIVDLYYSEIFFERSGGGLEIPAPWQQVPEVGGLESLEELAIVTRAALDPKSGRNDR